MSREYSHPADTERRIKGLSRALLQRKTHDVDGLIDELARSPEGKIPMGLARVVVEQLERDYRRDRKVENAFETLRKVATLAALGLVGLVVLGAVFWAAFTFGPPAVAKGREWVSLRSAPAAPSPMPPDVPEKTPGNALAPGTATPTVPAKPETADTPAAPTSTPTPAPASGEFKLTITAAEPRDVPRGYPVKIKSGDLEKLVGGSRKWSVVHTSGDQLATYRDLEGNLIFGLRDGLKAGPGDGDSYRLSYGEGPHNNPENPEAWNSIFAPPGPKSEQDHDVLGLWHLQRPRGREPTPGDKYLPIDDSVKLDDTSNPIRRPLVRTGGGELQWMAGRLGDAIRFDGKTGLKLSKHDTAKRSYKELTLEAWVLAEVAPKQGKGPLFHFGVAAGFQVDFYLNDKLNPAIRLHGGQTSGTPCVSTSPLKLGQWHHLAAALSDSRARLYVDGEPKELSPDCTFPEGVELTPTWGDFQLGYYDDQGFEGQLQHIRLMGKALSSFPYAIPVGRGPQVMIQKP